MKRNLIWSILGAGVILSLAATQQEHQLQKHEVVQIWSYQAGTGNPYTYTGAKVYCSSSSKDAPTFPQGVTGDNGTNLTDTAEAQTILLNAGFKLRTEAPNGLYQTYVK